MSETLEQARLRAEQESYTPHKEPICNGVCGWEEPHRHGFSCHSRCECKGICHPTCPAYEEDE